MALTRAQARTLLRRRLQEPTADQWTDAELDSLLNLGLSDVQKLIQALDPDAFMIATAQNIVADQRDYDWPTDAWVPVAVEWVGATETIAIEKIPRHEILGAASGETPRVTRFGRKLRLTPTPTENNTGGLLVYHIPSLEVTVDGTTLPVIPPLHGLVVLIAEKWAIGETGEGADEVRKEIDWQVSMLPNYYQSGVADRIAVDLVKPY